MTPMTNNRIGNNVMVMRSPATEPPEAPVAADTVSLVSKFKWQRFRHREATNAAIPEASFTTKVCMEKMTLSSLR